MNTVNLNTPMRHMIRTEQYHKVVLYYPVSIGYNEAKLV